jgi:phage repressor protein C with HTH and peptisase S24 domain
MALQPKRNERGERVRAARKAAGLSALQLAERSGYSTTGIRAIENGQNGLRPDAADAFAKVLKVSPAWLLTGEGSGGRPRGYPLIGKVGAGGSGDYADDYALGAAADWIDALPGMPVDDDIIVLDVEGDSMIPAVFDGDLAFFGPIRHDVDQLIGKRVMARLSDGRKFFKILKKGSEPGRWTLRSLNPATPDIEDVELAWVLPYRGSRPRD